jgi:hypothetical protein
MVGNCCHAVGNDQASTAIGDRSLLLMGMASVQDERRTIEAIVEELHVGRDLEPVRHMAIAIRDHPVCC